MPISSFSAPSAIAKPGVCTSTTRPASPYEGQVIYETDTDKTLVWNGSTWVYLSTGTANPVGLEYITTGAFGTGGIDVNNCFSSTYDGYRIIISNVVASTASFMIWKLRASGSVSSTGYYYAGAYRLFVGGGGDEGGANQAQWPAMSYNNSVPSFSYIDIWRPFLAATTSVTVLKQNYDAGVFMSGYHSVAASYDGFSLSPASGTFSSGNIVVYGYKKV